MPAISQIGFGTNDYATLAAWLSAEENNDYSGVGPIAEISSAADAVLSAAFQPRFGTASALTIRAATGSEFNGDFGGTHAKITGGQTLDIRMANVNFENVEIVGNFESTGDTYDGLTLNGCGVRGNLYLDKTLTTAVALTNTVIYSTSATNNRAIYIIGSDTDLTNVTVVATNTTAALGSIYIRNNGSTVSINDVAVYSVGDTYEIHSGDTPTVTGDYNAGSDALLIGANSIATLGTDDFEDYAGLDFRIKGTSELIGAGTGSGDIGAFPQTAPAPTLSIDSTDAEMAKQSTFGMTVSNPPVTPTASNTSLTLGAIQIPLSQATNTSGDTWDLEFLIGDIPRQSDATGYDWTLDVGTAVVANTTPVVSLVGNASIPLTVGDTYTEQGATVADSEDGVLAIGDPIFSPPLDLTTAGTYVATYTVTDSGGLVGTATRDVVVSASGGGGSGPSSTPDLFTDSFESGDFSGATLNTINFAWSAPNATSVVTGAAGANSQLHPDLIVVNDSRDWQGKIGDNAMRFRYPAGVNMSEQRFTFDAQDELWLRYWARVPVNLSHGSQNNKFLSIWSDTYDADGTATWQTRPSSGGSCNIVMQDGGVLGGEIQSTPFADVATDQGRWMQVCMQLKIETSNGAGDGILRLYRRWDDEPSFTLLHEKTDCVNQRGDGAGYRSGYFMGWANDPFSADTEWLIDNVEMSTGSLL